MRNALPVNPQPAEFETIGEAWMTLVPTFKDHKYRPLFIRINNWQSGVVSEISNLSPSRTRKRWDTYITQIEIDRVRRFHPYAQQRGVSFRFGGVEKTGKGIAEKRDFCLMSAVIRKRHLTIMYRSLELTGGFAFDLPVFSGLGVALGVSWESLTIFAFNANVHSVHDTENKSGTSYGIWKKLRAIFTAAEPEL